MRAFRVFPLLAAGLLLWAAGPEGRHACAAEEKRGDAEPQKSANDAEGVIVLIPGWTPGIDARSFPLGVTVIGSPERRLSHASDYPAGVTVLDNRERDDTASIVRIEVDEPTGAIVVTVSDAEEGIGQQEGPEPPAIRTVGPTVADQVRTLGQAPAGAGAALADRAVWIPVSALEPRDPDEPYPWQPVAWAVSIIDPAWTPVSAWPEPDPDRPYPWNPTEWAPWIIRPEWSPEDSWGRTLGITYIDTGSIAAPAVDRLAETAEEGRTESSSDR